jgi:hypothetical protein
MRRALVIAAALALSASAPARAKDVIKADQDFGSAWKALNLPVPSSNGEPVRKGDMPGSGLPCGVWYTGGSPLFRCGVAGTDYQGLLSSPDASLLFPTSSTVRLRDVTGLSVMGRSGSSSGAAQDITATADGQVLQRSGGALVWAAVPGISGTPNTMPYFNGAGALASLTLAPEFSLTTGTLSIAALGVTSAKLAAGAVTYAKIQNEAPGTILGNSSASPAAPAEVAIASSLSLSAVTGLGLANVPHGTPVLGELLMTGTGATVTPPTGFGRCRFDATNRDLTCIDQFGIETHGVQSSVGANFITGIGPDGRITRGGVSASQVAGLAPIATSGSASDLAPGSLTLDRVQVIPAGTLLGNPAASPASPTPITVGSGLSLSLGGTLSATSGADPLGYYLVTRSTSAPANAVNLGTLTTGPLKCTVGSSVCTPSTAVVQASGATTGGADLQGPGAYITSLTGPVTGAGPGAAATTLNLAAGASVTGLLPLGNQASPTGTGFVHVTSGSRDAAARAIDLSTADATGTLAAARFPALTGPVTTTAGSLATSLNLAGGSVSGALPCGSMPTLTGDLSNLGCALTLGANVVSYAKFQQVAANSLVMNPTGATANAQAVSLGGTAGIPQWAPGSPGTFSVFTPHSQRVVYGGSSSALADSDTFLFDGAGGAKIGNGTSAASLTFVGATLTPYVALWKDSTPTAAIALAMGAPGTGAPSSGLNIYAWNGTAWVDRFDVSNGGLVTIPGLSSAGNQCVQANAAGTLVLTGSACAAAALLDPGSNGIVARTALNTTAARSIVNGDATISITNGSGVSGNPSIVVGTIAESQVTNLTTDLAAKVPTTRTISTTLPLTGGGDLSANRTFAINDFVASGASHARGAVPDPGATAGTTRFLREDGWATPPSGTVTTVTGTAPIFITSTPTTTPNVTIQGAVTTGNATTSPANLGALSSGVLQQTSSGGAVSAFTTFAAGAGRVPYGSGSNGAFTDSADLTFSSTLFSIGNTAAGGAELIVAGSGAGSGILSIWSDTTPTFAAGIGMRVPGSAVNSDLHFSMWAAGAWTERMKLTNAGVLTIPGLASGGTQCVQASSTGALSGTGASCGGTGTVTTVTGTAPIFITSTPTTTPNVTIQGAVTTGSSSTGPANLGGLSSGVLQETTSGGVVSAFTTFAAGANRIPKGSGTAGGFTDSANFTYDGSNFLIGTSTSFNGTSLTYSNSVAGVSAMNVVNTSSSSSAITEMALGLESTFSTKAVGLTALFPSNYTDPNYQNSLLLELRHGGTSGNLLISVLDSPGGGISFLTANRTQRMFISGGGNVTVNQNLSVQGVTASSLVSTDSGHFLQAVAVDAPLSYSGGHLALTGPGVQHETWSESWQNSSTGLPNNASYFIIPTGSIGLANAGAPDTFVTFGSVGAALNQAYGTANYPQLYAMERATTGGQFTCSSWYAVGTGTGTDTEVFALYYTTNPAGTSATQVAAGSVSNIVAQRGAVINQSVSAIPSGAYVFMTIYRSDTASTRLITVINFKCQMDLW